MAPTTTPAHHAGPPPIGEEEAREIAEETYAYAYPLVLMELTRRVATNVARPDGERLRAPVNQFAHATRVATSRFRDVVRPNSDTLFSMLWYDVGREPLVVTLPDTQGRYFVFPLMDMWTDVYASLGTRTTGAAPGDFAIVAPGWQGRLPPGVRRIASPTPVGWLVGRLQANGEADFPRVQGFQATSRAVPLSAWGRPWEPPAGRVDPAIDMRTPPVEQVQRLGPAAFYALFAELLKHHAPHAADYAMLLRMERLGLVAGQGFDLARAGPAVQRALARAADQGVPSIVRRGSGLRVVRNGWSTAEGKMGIFGADYLLRAFIAYRGLAGLPPEEALYPSTLVDHEGRPLDGAASRYVLHFGPGQTPPARAFWSLTMYGADQFLVDNPIGRYAIGDRDKLAYNADGSLDLVIQHESPGPDKEANWLPAPAGPFSMNLRLYLPKAEATDRRWWPEAVRRVS